MADFLTCHRGNSAPVTRVGASRVKARRGPPSLAVAALVQSVASTADPEQGGRHRDGEGRPPGVRQHPEAASRAMALAYPPSANAREPIVAVAGSDVFGQEHPVRRNHPGGL